MKVANFRHSFVLKVEFSIWFSCSRLIICRFLASQLVLRAPDASILTPSSPSRSEADVNPTQHSSTSHSSSFIPPSVEKPAFDSTGTPFSATSTGPTLNDSAFVGSKARRSKIAHFSNNGQGMPHNINTQGFRNADIEDTVIISHSNNYNVGLSTHRLRLWDGLP